MATDLEKDNLINALSGDPIIKACAHCKHYYKEKLSYEDARCTRDLKVGYHPVTGKKAMLGETYKCEAERGIKDTALYRSNEPCREEGRWFEEKVKVKWFSSWFK